MARLGLRAGIYANIQRNWVKPLVFRFRWPRLFNHAGERGLILETAKRVQAQGKQDGPLGWFHAASVGELEMLAPIIEKWLGLKTEEGVKARAVLTVFSESATGPLEKLSSQLKASGASVLFSGYSPWEGEWAGALEAIHPDFLMTARYEAWPEMWIALAMLGIPLEIVGARARGSLRWARRLCSWLGQRAPLIRFFTVEEAELAPLQREFPGAQALRAGDPRWEQVARRAEKGNARARELIAKHGAFKRPWGVLGSAWPEDLALWSKVLREHRDFGTLWIAPHRIDEESVERIEGILKECGIPFERSKDERPMDSSSSRRPPRCLIVNEMGALAELYAAADWAYVGGGFTHGVHNTIEPALYGIPVACGPKNAERFPEIDRLRACGQLTLIEGAGDLERWFLEETGKVSRKARWQDLARQQLGASDVVMRSLRDGLSRWKLH